MSSTTEGILDQVISVPMLGSQKGMWLTESLDSSGHSHIVPVGVKIRGQLNYPALQSAIHKLVIRHENLRVRFGIEHGEPQQWVQNEIDSTVKYIDLQSSGADLEESLRLELKIPMDLGKGPLFRASLLFLGAESHALLFAIHHLVIDNKSSEQLLHDFYTLYAAEVCDGSASLPPLPISYSAHAQSAITQPHEVEKVYWCREMADLPEPLTFASGQNIVPTNQQVAQGIDRLLNTSAVHALSRLAVSGFTPFMVHLAITALLVHRHTGSPDIILGVPLSTLSDSDAPSLTGLFVNTLPLRLHFSPTISFESLLNAVRTRLLRAMMHVSLPLHELIRMLRLERHAGSNPLFKVCVNYAKGEATRKKLGECEFESLAIPSPKAAFEINFSLIENVSSRKLYIEFDEDMLSNQDAEDLLDQYLLALAAASATPSIPIEDICLQAKPPHLNIELIAGFEPVHIRFERQVLLSPSATAVICNQQETTYLELNGMANRLASFLIKQNVGRDSLVAICTDRSLEMVVSVLAVLKAGGAYIPIDQDNPDDRILFILKDTDARLLLTSESLLYRFKDMPTGVLCVDDKALYSGYESQNPDSTVTPDNLVYCVYTSGSTGRPKGALNTHGGFANLVDWYVTRGLTMPATARVMLASSFGFDATQKNLLGPLCVGASLIIPSCSPAEHLSFTSALATYGPTWVNCAPSAFRTFMHAVGVSTVRTLVLAGEPLDDAIVSALRGKPLELVNSYGPSECADVAIWCARSMLEADGKNTSMPLGQPVANVAIYILNDRFQPAPVGVPGEIYICGVGLGRGYLRRPDLTAERYLPDPFSGTGSRMYKTGDIGRRRRDGMIEYLGRADSQIKLRGNRIEPGEIEICILGCEEIMEAIVRLKELSPGDSHLTAYFVAREGYVVNVDMLRHRLHQTLPSYMVPTAWVSLPALPLNLNGKVDYKALPMPQRSFAKKCVITQPNTPTEMHLVEIWKTVLGVEEVSVLDNFFDLWGQSLLAAKMAAMVSERLGVTLSMRMIFDAENIVAMARHIDEIEAASAKLQPGPIKRQPRKLVGDSTSDYSAP